ncbi:MAG: hypothetical protein ACFB16_23695 [Phormidesmis sp.]
MNITSESTTVVNQQLPPPQDHQQSIAFAEQTLSAVRCAPKDSPVIVDFDETLLLRNSTQAYLSSIYPRPLGVAFIVAIKALKPWRLLPSPYSQRGVSRDWLLVVVATLLFPWTLLIWRRRAKEFAEQHCNLPLAQAIDANTDAPIVIATLGFGFIVNPLIRHLPMASVRTGRVQVVACRFWQGILDRATGKLEMVLTVLEDSAVAKAIVVTDSETDRPLLDRAQTPCLLTWPDATFVSAMSDVYLPLFYSEKIKNPGQSHFVKRILLGHWVFGLIGWSCISAHPILSGFSLLLLTLSYWCVYEIGYQENDAVGERYEQKPTLSSAYQQQQYSVNLNSPWPWFYALALALPGCILFTIAQTESPLLATGAQLLHPVASASLWAIVISNYAVWAVYLTIVRSCFWIYNQFNEATRVWMYPLLQVQRMFGFSVLASTNAVGTLLLMSYLISRWIQYCIYRCGGDRKKFPVNISCLLLFILLFVSLASGKTANPSDFMTWQAAIAFTYCSVRAIKKVKQIRPQLGLIRQGDDSHL